MARLWGRSTWAARRSRRQRWQGNCYIDIEDKDNVAVVDAKTMKVTAHYDLARKERPGGAGDGREESYSVCLLPQPAER